MFQLLGRIVSRAWVLVLIAWAVLVGGIHLAAPPWDSVAQDKEFAFLPAKAPSRRAEEVFQKAFPKNWTPSNIVLVLQREGDNGADLKRDLKFISDAVEPALRQIAQAEGGLAYEEVPTDEPLFSDEPAPPPSKPRSVIAAIHTPNGLGTGALLVSPDGKVLLVVMDLTTEFLSTKNWPTITAVEDLARNLGQEDKLPPGMSVYITGSAVIGRDHTLAEYQGARATGTLTVVLVIVLLVLIYRAPLLALIPLLTVYLGVQIGLGILALLSRAGYITLFQGLEVYLTVLAYGAGVDYSLFLTARYKEVLDTGVEPHEAVAASVRDVGAALTASAATVICGIGMMFFAEFGKFREAGIAIPLGIFLVLVTTLTLSPALLSMAGRRAFWPQKVGGERPAHPGWFTRFVDFRRLWDWVGDKLVRRPGTIWLTTVGLMLPFVIAAALLRNYLSYDVVGSLPGDAPSVVGTRVLQQHVAPGVLGPTTVLLIDPRIDFSSASGKGLVANLTTYLRDHRQELGLADVRTLSNPLGTPEGVQRSLAINLGDPTRRQALEDAALARYATDLGGRVKTGTRIDLVMDQSPFSRRSIADLDRVQTAIRDTLPPELRDGAEMYFVGPTASVRDLESVMQRDRVRIEGLVLVSVLVILIVLLRRVFLSLYLLASVLFSYLATLGVTFLVFWALDPHGFNGIDWKVAIFLFTILIAVGEDYNIFLMARIDEETRRHGPIRGITHALDRTGPVISSCGIIMAGTFASLMAGSLTEMKQLGFALAFGVLLDTFVVRPLLVPAFLILVRTGRLSPWRCYRKQLPEESSWNSAGQSTISDRRCAERRSSERRSTPSGNTNYRG